MYLLSGISRCVSRGNGVNVMVSIAGAAKTWASIEGRATKRPAHQIVPEEWLKTFEDTIEQIESSPDAAFERWPSLNAGSADQKMRIEYWKMRILAAVKDKRMKGVIAGWYHEYTAATIRGYNATSADNEHNDDGNIDTETQDDMEIVIPSYSESRIRSDAYAACAASLEGYSTDPDESTH